MDETTFTGGVEMTPEGLIAAHPNAIFTVGDTMVEPLAMLPEMVNVEDVAYALSNAARFTGHVKRTDGFPFNVAQHACNVARLVMRRSPDPDDWAYALHHDDTEAFLSDMARPIKHYNDFGDAYRVIESGLMEAIAAAFALPQTEMPEVVHWADNVALRVECRDFMGPTMKAMYADGNEDVECYFPEPVKAWSHERAEREYLGLHHAIEAIRAGHVPEALAAIESLDNEQED